MQVDNPWFWGETPLQKHLLHLLSSGMAHDPMFGSDSQKPASPAVQGHEPGGTSSQRAGSV